MTYLFFEKNYSSANGPPYKCVWIQIVVLVPGFNVFHSLLSTQGNTQICTK